MHEQTGMEILQQGIGDYRIVSLSWVNDDEDLRICFRAPPGAKADVVILRFVWISELVIAMDFGEYAGTPLLFDSRCHSRSDASGWKVELILGGAPDGSITFHCNDVVLEGADPM